jgi:hypothetical protein
VPGAVLELEWGCSTFAGSGNREARCLFRRPNTKRAEPVLGGCRGRGLCSKETCPPELSSDREDSDCLGTGRDSDDVPSWQESLAALTGGASVSGHCVVDSWRGSSASASRLFMNENGCLFKSVLFLGALSMDLRRRAGRSLVLGSNERRRRLNCCILPRFRGTASSCSATVGAVVIMAGAVVRQRCTGHVTGSLGSRAAGDILATGSWGTGGGTSAACSLALRESCESEAWRKRIRLKRRVLGVCSCTGGDGGSSSCALLLLTSLARGRPPSSDTANRAGASCSGCCSVLSVRNLKSPVGSRVLRRLRSRSLRFVRRPFRGIALGRRLASHLRRYGSHSAGHGSLGGRGGCSWVWTKPGVSAVRLKVPGPLRGLG